MKTALSSLFERDLDRLHNEIAAYNDELKLWELYGEIPNPAGNLCLHLVGTLNHFIGATLANTGYVRQRELEFSTKDVPKAKLLTQIKETKQLVIATLNQLSDDDLKADYPLQPLGYVTTTAYFLLDMSTHLNYHLGQINYHRKGQGS